MQSVEFCGSCGKSFAASERFCTNCGAGRTVQNSAPTNVISSEVVESQTNENIVFQKPKRDLRNIINVKVLAIVLIPLLLLILGGGAYWFTSLRVNLEARDITGLLLNSDSRVEKFVSDSCPSFKTKLDETYRNLLSKSVAVNLDYTEALNLSETNAGEADSVFEIWSQDFLASKLGKKAAKLKYANYVERDLLKQVESFCKLPRKMNSVISYARQLDQTIDDIKSPGYWQPDGFYRSDEDPNIAWRWAPKSSYYCSSATDGCIRIQLVTRLECRGSIDAKMGLMYTNGGSIQDYEYGDISDVSPGRVYGLTINHYGYEYGWWRLESISCNS